MSKENFLGEIRKGIDLMRAAGPDVTLVHHNDADGLTSAAVLQTCLIRAGFSVRRICIERVHPPIVTRIHEQFPSTIFYVDLGGQAAPVISDANNTSTMLFVLFLITIIFRYLGIIAVVHFTPTYLVREIGLPPNIASYATALYFLGGVIFTPFV